jgi:hypothetical protein
MTRTQAVRKADRDGPNVHGGSTMGRKPIGQKTSPAQRQRQWRAKRKAEAKAAERGARRLGENFKVRTPGEPAHRPAMPHDAAIIRGMVERGDKSQHICAYFDANPGRISEVRTEYRFPGVPAAPPDRLPPRWPQMMQTPQAQQAVTVEVTGIAAEFRREQQKTNEKLDHVLRQLASFGRALGVIERPAAPRLTRRTLLEG